MKINKDKLKEALEIVKPGLANKEIIEQTTSFAFISGRVITYNDEISIAHPITDLDIEGAIQAEELYKFLGKVKTEEITVINKEGEIVLKSGRATTGFTLISEIMLPLNEEIAEIGDWKPLPEKFVESLKFTYSSCSKDMSDPKLTCVHVNEEGFIESSDNFRITHCKLKKKFTFPTFLIPATSVDVVVKQQPVEIAKGNGWVHFKTEKGTVISCRVYQETYVDTSSYLKRPKKEGVEIIFPDKLDEVLEKAKIFSHRKQTMDESVELELNEDMLLVKSNSESGWFKERVKIDYKEDFIAFSITPHLLQDILSQTKRCVLYESYLRFEGDDWIYITSLRTKSE